MSRAIRTAITRVKPANSHHCSAYIPLRTRPRPSGKATTAGSSP